MVELAGAGQLPAKVGMTGQAHRRDEHEGPLATVRLGLDPRDLGLPHGLGGPSEVSMMGRSSTPPPGAGHSLAKARACSGSVASTR